MPDPSPPMIHLQKALAAWRSPAFNDILKAEIERLDADLLPLQQGLERTSHVGTARPRAMLLRVSEADGCLRAKVGLFYSGIIAGCSCADDPTPIDEIDEYCEVEFEIDKRTGMAEVRLLVE